MEENVKQKHVGPWGESRWWCKWIDSCSISKDLDENEAIQGQSLHWHQSHADFLNTQTLPWRASGRGRPPAACCQRGCCLCLVMFIKMAAVSYLNVNYCYDTQDNLTCFSNLFFLVIRCRNWKIFPSVTTVRKVRWQGAGASPQALNQDAVAPAQLAVTWTARASDQRWSFWNQAGGTCDL